MLDSSSGPIWAHEMESTLRKLPCFLVFAILFSTLVVPLAAQESSAEPASATTQSNASAANGAQAAPANPAQTSIASNTNPNSLLRLGPGDLIEVSVYNVPDLTSKVRIGSNGDVYLPLIDYTHVSGLTIEEAQAIIGKRLTDGGFVKDAHVTIFINEYASQGVSVLGEVGRPGVYPVLGHQRLFDLISSAGGFNEKAGRTVTITHRNEPDKPITVTLARNITDDPTNNVEIFPGDTVAVRRADVVYVLGEVGRPSGLLMNDGSLTVMQAIALVGGTNRTAKMNGVKILHKGPNGVTATQIKLKKILQAKAPDIPLQADDILFVPGSATKALTSRGMDTLVSTASSLTLVATRP